MGAIGGFGGKAPNDFMKKTDLAIAVGTKLADFTTGSWSNFENPNFKLVSINVSRFDANKHMAQSIVGDAKVSSQDLTNYLGTWRSPEEWYKKSRSAVESWNNYLEKKVVQQIKKLHPTHMLQELSIENLTQVILL